MTKIPASRLKAQQKFNRLVAEWDQAERECREAYVAWEVANRHRQRIAIDRNNAWGELQMAEAKTPLPS